VTTPAPPPRYDRSFADTGQTAPPWDGPGPRITGVHVAVTAPEGVNLVVVRLLTDQPGLTGLGCATFAYRAAAIAHVIEHSLAPRIIGRRAADITDLVTGLRLGPYWRGGPIDNNAVAGIDLALWDLKARLAGVPVWSLLGGRLRAHVPAYSTAYGRDLDDLIPRLAERISQGDNRFRVILAGSEEPGRTAAEPAAWIRDTVATLATIRRELGDVPEIVVDAHGFLAPADAYRLAAELEPLRPFYLEDPLAPEDLRYLPELRRHTTLPIAVGELFTGPEQYLPLLAQGCIDYLRCHVSAVGGFTAALRIAAAAELFGVRLAWHGPLDLSPVGHAANLALDVASPAFGIHEHTAPAPQTLEMFPGAPQLDRGSIQVPDTPGWGVDFVDAVALQWPPVPPDRLSGLEGGRRPDGSLHRP
jgi:mannonate dehydratase